MKINKIFILIMMFLLVSTSVLAIEETENRQNIILGVGIVSGIMILIANGLDEIHKILKLGMMLIVLFFMRIITSISTIGNGSSGIGFLKLYDRSLFVIIAWFILYFLFEVILRPFAENKGWLKKRENDG